MPERIIGKFWSIIDLSLFTFRRTKPQQVQYNNNTTCTELLQRMRESSCKCILIIPLHNYAASLPSHVSCKGKKDLPLYIEDGLANRWKILYMQQVFDDKRGDDPLMASDSFKVKMMLHVQLHDIIGIL